MHAITITVDENLSDPVPDEWRSRLVEAALAALAHQAAPAGELTVLLTTDEMMAALNQSHRGMRGPTDVLSFPGGEMPPIPDLPHYFGDIAISLPRAAAQAASRGHAAVDELALLVVHSVLHLLGRDHAETDEQEQMWSTQDAILALLGISIQTTD